MNPEEEFIREFNEFYPFDKYILREPKSIQTYFDDLILKEIFIPKALPEIVNCNGYLVNNNPLDYNEIYVIVQTKLGELKIGYLDFSEEIRENIRAIIYKDFGLYEWQCLYMEPDEDESFDSLQEVLEEESKLIKEKYGDLD